MTNKTRLYTFFILFLLTSVTPLMSRKFGHLNSQNLIAIMPEAKAVDAQLLAFKEKLAADTDKLQTALDEKAKAFEAEYQSGKMSNVQAQNRYALLEQEQRDILTRRQEDQERLLKKREELFQPVFDKVEKAIQDIGKEQGFTMIFDSSFYNAILFAEDAEDISNLVKTRLGI